jgi:hypothetical protein
MESSAISHVSQSVYRQFPELRGAHPTVHSQPGGKYLLTFSGKVQTSDGKSLTRTVRVTADEKGSVLKLSTSR